MFPNKVYDHLSRHNIGMYVDYKSFYNSLSLMYRYLYNSCYLDSRYQGQNIGFLATTSRCQASSGLLANNAFRYPRSMNILCFLEICTNMDGIPFTVTIKKPIRFNNTLRAPALYNLTCPGSSGITLLMLFGEKVTYTSCVDSYACKRARLVKFLLGNPSAGVGSPC